MENLIVVRQLPIIEERLRELKAEIDGIVSETVSLACTEETIKSVKDTRSTLRKRFDELEAQRKAVKSAVMAPYDAFESIYRECISDGFRMADAALKCKIDDVENTIKQRCEDGLREYFAELCAAHGVDWLEYEQAGIAVDMASAKQKTPKKLREKLVAFVVSVSADIEMISHMESADEILVEYKTNGLDATKAIGTVHERHRRKQEERAALDTMAEQKAVEKDAVARVEALARPVVKEPEKPVKVSLVLYPTKTQWEEKIKPIMQQLKAICDMEKIRYE